MILTSSVVMATCKQCIYVCNSILNMHVGLIYRFTVSADLYSMVESGAQLFISFIDVGQSSIRSGLSSSHFLLAKGSKRWRGARVGKKS